MSKVTPGQAGRNAIDEAKRARDEVVRLAQRKGLEALNRIIALAEDPNDFLKAKDPKTYIYANLCILERGFGKPDQALNLANGDGEPLKIEVNIVRSKPDGNASS